LHFIRPDIFVKIMPDFLPFQLELVYISGAFEIIGGAGLLSRKFLPIAVMGLILLLVAVFPANINMACHPERFPAIPLWLLFFRLPLQLLLGLWVWNCRDPAPCSDLS
jgi:uncharacterized membrane protein